MDRCVQDCPDSGVQTAHALDVDGLDVAGSGAVGSPNQTARAMDVSRMGGTRPVSFGLAHSANQTEVICASSSDEMVRPGVLLTPDRNGSAGAEVRTELRFGQKLLRTEIDGNSFGQKLTETPSDTN